MLSSPARSATLAGLDVVAISPAIPRTPSLQSSIRAKRRVIPSLERSASKKTFLIISRDTFASQLDTADFNLLSLPSIPKRLFQSGEAQIVARLPLNLLHEQSRASRHIIQANPLHHAYQEVMQNTSLLNPIYQELHQADMPRHIILPFDLVVDPAAWSESNNSELLMNLFSDCISVGFGGWCLLYQLKVLPPKPWPKTIAGVPCYLTIDELDQGPMPPLLPAYMGNPQIRKDIDGRNLSDWDSVFDIIKEHFDVLDISITEIQYWDRYIMIVLEFEAVDWKKVPKTIANLRCFYLFENQMDRPEILQARLQHEPAPGNPDETRYSILRPGVRLTSDYNPCKPGAYLATSSGILVKDRIGNVFMTAAFHGFPSEYGTTVFQPTPIGDQAIGELIMEISHTDIALVKLKDDITFENITFNGDILTESIRLKQFVKAGKTTAGNVMMDSPDTGYIEGAIKISCRMRIPSDDPLEPEQQWLRTIWFYGGQESSQDLPNGICGSAIWNEDGSVLGFFRYAAKTGIMKDWCAGIAADELMNRGYSVVAPPIV